MHDIQNPWTVSNKCEMCDEKKGCNRVEVPVKIDQNQIIGWQNAVIDGDKDAQEVLKNLGQVASMIDLKMHKWHFGDWGECNKKCADAEGPGYRSKTYLCLTKEGAPIWPPQAKATPVHWVESPNEDCYSTLGDPEAHLSIPKEKCNTEPCAGDQSSVIKLDKQKLTFRFLRRNATLNLVQVTN